MLHSLPLFIQLRGRPVLLLGTGEAAQAKRRLLERAGARIITDEGADEGAGAPFAIVALETKDATEAAAARLKARGILVNAPDRPHLCDFTLPAIIDRNPVLIAIATGGASAGLAKALRQRLETMLPSSLGPLASALGKARDLMRQRWPDAAARRKALDNALEEGGVLDPLVSHSPDAPLRWLTGKQTEPLKSPAIPASRLVPIVIASDDPDDLTLRAARLLGQADHVFYSAAIAPAIVHRARADAARHLSETRPEWTGGGLALWLHKEAMKEARE